MYGLNYSYDIHVAQNSSMIDDQNGMGLHFPGCIDIVISSKSFDDYESCVNELTDLLCVFATVESRLSNKPYAIVKKMNPLFSEGLEDPAILENTAKKSDTEWDRLTVLRAYAADVDMLKNNSQISSGIVGQLKINQESVDRITDQNFQTLQ